MTLAWRLALRDMRGGLGGLALLAVCLFLGVATIAGVGSLSASIVDALESEGHAILGGDVAVEVPQRRANQEERAAFEALGETAELVLMRANVSTPDNSETMIAELKAVDESYPLYGDFALQGGGTVQEALADGVLLGPGAAERLGISTGDRVRIGRARLPVAGLIAEEPDKVAEGFVLGPTVLLSMSDFVRTGLERPGSLYEVQYRIRLDDPGADLEAIEEDLLDRFPTSALDVDTRDNAAPGARRFILNTGQFLTMVGLTALLVAGVGVGSGVTSYLSSKTRAIAALKSMGADSRTILSIYLIQIGLVTVGAVIAGATIGAFVPSVVGAVAGETLPVPPAAGVYPLPLLTAILYGALAAFAFAIWPLMQAKAVPAARLFRAGIERLSRPPLTIAAMIGLAAFAIFLLAVLQAREPLFAAGFLAASIGVLVILALLATGIVAAARAFPRPRQPLMRLAVANLTRPGGMTRQLTVALGLGLTLFAVLAVIETNLSGQIEQTIPDKAPSHFILDIPGEGEARFREIAAENGGEGELRIVPTMRGPITAVDGMQVADMEEIPEGAWVLRGDRGLTFAREVPQGNRIVAGEWWAEDYDGPQLISLDAEIAETLDLHVGDTLTVNVLGIPLTAEISSLREIDWSSMGFNFALVYSPGPIEQAPYSYMATVRVPPERDRALSQALGNALPSASIIRVADVVSSAETLLGQLSTAIRAASSVAILAGIAVLVGAIVAARRARTYDAVMLKVLGATRGQILFAFLTEFVILSVAVAGLALILGAAGGWYVITQVFELEWLPDWAPVIATVGIGALVVTALSLIGSWSALRARPARALRAL